VASIKSLPEAVQAGDVAAVREAIRLGKVSIRGETGESLILGALFRGHKEIAMLLADSCELNLFEAAAMGKVDRIRGLLSTHRDILNERASDGFTALHYAAFMAHHEVATLLLQGGARVDSRSRNSEENTPLHAAIAGRCDLQSVEVLVSHGADVNCRAARGVTPLHLAGSRGNRPITDYLLGHGTDVRATMENGQTAADIARVRGHAELANHLEAVMQKP